MLTMFINADYVNVVINIESVYLCKYEFFVVSFYNFKGNL